MCVRKPNPEDRARAPEDSFGSKRAFNFSHTHTHIDILPNQASTGTPEAGCVRSDSPAESVKYDKCLIVNVCAECVRPSMNCRY